MFVVLYSCAHFHKSERGIEKITIWRSTTFFGCVRLRLLLNEIIIIKKNIHIKVNYNAMCVPGFIFTTVYAAVYVNKLAYREIKHRRRQPPKWCRARSAPNSALYASEHEFLLYFNEISTFSANYSKLFYALDIIYFASVVSKYVKVLINGLRTDCIHERIHMCKLINKSSATNV